MNKRLTTLALAGILVLGMGVPSGAAPDDGPVRPASSGDPGPREFIRDPVREFGSPGTSPTRTEGVAGGFVYVPIVPYRTIDSRLLDNGFMVGGEEAVFTVMVDFRNTPKLPEGAVAVTYNLTVDSTVGEGFCSLYPATVNWPGNSSINWKESGQTIANGGTVAIDFLTRSGQVAIFCGPVANLGAHFILDITGYYI